jgi:O-antigen/teichoic acid export membrane protein
LKSNRFTAGALSNVVAAILGIAVNFLLTPFLIFHLGGERYGLWTLILTFSVSNGLFAFADLGIASSIVKMVGAYKATDKLKDTFETINAGLCAFGAIGACLTLLCWGFAEYLTHELLHISAGYESEVTSLIRIFGVIICIDLLTAAMSAVLMGLQAFSLSKSLQIFGLLLQLVIFVCVIELGGGLLLLGIVMLCISLLKLGLGILLVRRQLPEWSFGFTASRQVLRELFSTSGVLLFIRIQAAIYRGMDRLILGAFLISAVLADYDIVAKLMGLGVVSVSIVSSMVLSPASGLMAQGRHVELVRLFLRSTKYSLLLSFPVLLMILFHGEWLLGLWVGEPYVHLALVGGVFALNIPFVALGATAQNILIGVGRVKWVAIVSTSCTLLNLVISLILVRRMGLLGVVYGTLISGAISAVLVSLLTIRSIHIPAFKYLSEVLFRGALPAIVAVMFHILLQASSMFHDSPIFILFVAAIVYLLASYWFALSREEKSRIRFVQFWRSP